MSCGATEDEEYEEERAIVMVELQGVIDPDNLFHHHSSFKILGIETDNPVLQLGNYVFSGEYEDTMGTAVFFEKPEEGDAENRAKYVCKTDKKLLMKRIFLEKKVKEPENATSEAPNISGKANGSDVEVRLGEAAGNVHEEVDRMESDEACTEQQEALATDVFGSELTNGLPDAEELELPSESAAISQADASESEDAEETVEAIQRAVQAFISQDALIIRAQEVADSANVPTSSINGAHVQPKVLSPNGGVDASESEAKMDGRESEASSVSGDFVILSETEGSNEASRDCCDSALEGPATSAVGSSDCRASTSSHGLFYSPEVSNSESVTMASGSKDIKSDSFIGIINNLMTGAHSVSSLDPGASTSQSDQLPQSMDIADSASHLIKDSSNRISDSSLPVICDSASNGRKLLSDDGSFKGDDSVNSDDGKNEASVTESIEVASTSEAACVTEPEEVAEYADVFDGEEPMECSEEQVSHSQPISGVCSSRSHMEDSAMVYGNPSDTVETSQVEVSGSYASRSSFGEEFPQGETSSRVNSTVGELSGASAYTSESLCTFASAHVQDSLAGPSQGNSSASENHELFAPGKGKDSADSTSNQVICCDQNEENLKLITGIDSTTNESRDKFTIQNECAEMMEQNISRVAPNEGVDSTMNNFSISDSALEDVDFEMREVNNSGSEETTTGFVAKSSDANYSIDSTSNAVVSRGSIPYPSCSRTDVTESSASGYEHSSSNADKGESVCEVTESCSEGSPTGEITESLRTSNEGIGSPSGTLYSDDNEENSSSCKVTESHIDENRCTYSYDDVHFPGTSRSTTSEVAESSSFAGCSKSQVTDSDSKCVGEVTESFSVEYDDDSLSLNGDSNCEVNDSFPSSSKHYVSYSNAGSRIDSEEGASDRVTESSFEMNQMNISDSFHAHSVDISTYGVSDSTNISHSSDYGVLDNDQITSMRAEDSLLCEVTGSSSWAQLQVMNDESSNSVSESFEGSSSYSGQVTHSFSTVGASTSCDVSESACQNSGPCDEFSIVAVSSGDQREPSSSGVTVSSASDTPLRSVTVPSSNDGLYSGAAAGMSSSEVSIQFAVEEEILLANPTSENFSVSDSSERNAADSTEGSSGCSSNRQRSEMSSSGSDNSKMPSSTSN